MANSARRVRNKGSITGYPQASSKSVITGKPKEKAKKAIKPLKGN